MLSQRGVLGDAHFKKRQSLCDAVPACWKHLKPEEHSTVCDVVRKIRDEVEEGKPTWMPETVLELAEFAPLDDALKLRACCIAAQQDPSVMTMVAEELSTQAQENAEPSVDEFFALRPKDLLDEHKKDKTNNAAAVKLFDQMCNFTASASWKMEERLAVSDSLNVEVSKAQQDLFNPTMKQVIGGFIMCDATGRRNQQDSQATT